MNVDLEKASKIAALNDMFRRSGATVTMTVGVQELDDLEGLLAAVRRFNVFTEDNDPYHEHDFGELRWDVAKVYWKIDYYDQNLEFGEEPLSPNCRRVMTVMIAGEY